jgi:hypothetical protein
MIVIGHSRGHSITMYGGVLKQLGIGEPAQAEPTADTVLGVVETCVAAARRESTTRRASPGRPRAPLT